jgi:hypothetical protein
MTRAEFQARMAEMGSAACEEVNTEFDLRGGFGYEIYSDEQINDALTQCLIRQAQAEGKQTCSPVTGAVQILRLSWRFLLISGTRELSHPRHLPVHDRNPINPFRRRSS